MTIFVTGALKKVEPGFKKNAAGEDMGADEKK